jgi:prolyl-tRNA editing enzyme YbaK/EbsC (Cys-tRNA(Pro) deacylase)
MKATFPYKKSKEESNGSSIEVYTLFIMKLESVRLLEEKGVDYRLIKLRKRSVTVKDVVNNAKSMIHPEEICKTIIIRTSDRRYYGVILLGTYLIDSIKLSGIVGKFSLASLMEVEKLTGSEPGEVCPLTLRLPILLDLRVLNKKNINFGSGDKLCGLEIRSSLLSKLINYEIVDVASAY